MKPAPKKKSRDWKCPRIYTLNEEQVSFCFSLLLWLAKTLLIGTERSERFINDIFHGLEAVIAGREKAFVLSIW